MEAGILSHLLAGKDAPDEMSTLDPDTVSDAARELAESYRSMIQEYPPSELEKSSRIPDSLMTEMRKLGLFGLIIPKKYGGLGFTMVDYLHMVSVMAENDMAMAIIPLAHLSIGLKGILLYGNDEQKEKYLTPAASGEMVFSYCLTEPKTGSDAQHIETTAHLSDDKTHYILNGTKTYITNGGYAGGLTVFAQIEGGKAGYMGAFIVETGWEGVKIGPDMDKMGLKVSSTTSINFKDVRVPVENLLGEPGDGFKIAMTILNYGRLGLGAASAGAILQSVRDMKERAESRKQFGQPIGSFELVREKIDNAAALYHSVWSMTQMTAALLQSNPLANIAVESSHTKLYGTESAWDVLYEALQVAGGAGYLKFLPYEKRMRDFRVTTVFEGTSEIHTMYPPLTVARSVSKEMKEGGGGNTLRVLGRLKRGRADLSWMPTLSTAQEKAALKEAEKNIRAARKLLGDGMKKYRKELATKQLYLRSITRLSYTAYAILAALWINAKYPLENQPAESPDAVFDYLTGEARKMRSGL